MMDYDYENGPMFKVGDKVRLDLDLPSVGLSKGDEVTITEVVIPDWHETTAEKAEYARYRFKVPNREPYELYDVGFKESQEPRPEPEEQAEVEPWNVEQIEQIEQIEPEVDLVNHPPHYKFSNGAEVLDITEHLNFNGGNVVKYVARSTRLDGQNKGNVLEDLNKALVYLNREIGRLSNGA